MILLDTDVMIDLFREYPPALRWLDTLDDEIILPGYVVMELLQGSRDKVEQSRVESELNEYSWAWPSPETCEQAVSVFAAYHLSHNLGIIDALIGQLAVSLNLPLHTFNQKHYSNIPGIKIVAPYRRG